MKNIIFFDTETTGNTEKDVLCQIAYKITDLNGTEVETFSEMYKPSTKIPPEASAVHHISNKMIENKKSFQESEDKEKIKEIFENKENILVAHNAPFDLMMIKKEGIEPKKFICTLRVARELDPEDKIERYNLQYLRYLLEIEIEAQAHDALGDVMVLEKLFERLKNKIKETENLNDSEALEKMIEISSHPSIFKKLNFGKYKGRTIEEVLKIDRGWLEWLLREKEKSDQLDEDWIYTLKYYLK